MSLTRHGEEMRCRKCGGEVDPVAYNDQGESRFAFMITQRKDGTPVDPPYRGTVESATCRDCGEITAYLDALDLPDEEAEWRSLGKWNRGNA